MKAAPVIPIIILQLGTSGQAGQFRERIGELLGEHPTFPVAVALAEPADAVD